VNFRRSLPLSLPLQGARNSLDFRSAKQRTRGGNFMRSALRTGTDLRPNPSSRIRTALHECNAVNGKSCETVFPKANQPTNSFRDENLQSRRISSLLHIAVKFLSSIFSNARKEKTLCSEIRSLKLRFGIREILAINCNIQYFFSFFV